MIRKGTFWLLFLLVASLSLAPAMAQDDSLTIGMILVGASNDQGWNQAHYEGGEYVVEKLAEQGIDANLIVFENLNPVVNPQVTVVDVAESMVDEGASLIFTTSDEFEPDTLTAAEMFPEVTFVHISGSAVLGQTPADVYPDRYEASEPEEAPANFSNLMGKMEHAKAIAGCAAALTTESGQIGYVGPLINAETRRLVAATYLGAKHCYENYNDAEGELSFEVVWIGFWLPTPDTLDPTQVTNTFFDTGADVVISGIDPQDALIVAGSRRGEGEDVYAIPYDYEGACDTAPDACLGIPYFHWGPNYLRIAEAVVAGTYEQEWVWDGPDWGDINNPETTTVGWLNGPALSEEAAENLQTFIDEMTAFQTDPENEGRFFLWEGPLTLADGTELAAEGEFVDPIEIWYLPLLLDGIQGDSTLE